MKSKIDAHFEPLPGYRLAERIGSGGYGEVWRAHAPGGLEKAIKLVYGAEHEKRATHELKALQRIKELRHPFLLSLERIEVVQGRLVVVTELADGSLKDRFDECQSQGQIGIPRHEIVNFLREAADALDYMVDAHQLQHLDIKPENLLIVANHVKVADFGLVKDVQQSQASIVGGMTPLYSAPEVFRGQPSPRSDQYSLAILFQEMLTGTLPFSGTTAAELTLQHLNDEPDLGTLQGADRYVVARALSKDPLHRYSSCREFVQAVWQATSDGATSLAGEGARPLPNSPAATGTIQGGKSVATEVFDDDVTACGEHAASMLVELPEAGKADIRELGPLTIHEDQFQAVPTLFLGIGGAGGRVLRHLRRRLNASFGSPAQIPAFRMLLLDTDPQDLMRLATDDGSSISTDETLALPLRRPQHYRDNAARLLRWLGRRWLYNIPKSMRTEGLRPLGRLALVDHARQACQRIRKTLADAIATDNVTLTREHLRLPVMENACRVYVVCSISGGTGSGISLDVAYAIRAALKKLEIAQMEIIGVLLHATGRDPRFSDLARVNVYSWLNEYQHFLRSSSQYPGDESCGLPAHEPGVKPFDHAYLLHLGEALAEDDFDRATSSVAEYLHLDAVSPAHMFFDGCRQSEGTFSPTLRSFGVQVTSAIPDALGELLTNELCEHVVTHWQKSGGEDAAQIRDICAEFDQTHLKLRALAEKSRRLLESSLGGDEDSYLQTWLAAQCAGSTAPELGQAIDVVDQLFQKGESNRPGATLAVAQQMVSTIVEPLATELRHSTNTWLGGFLDLPEYRLSGAKAASQQLESHLQQLRSETRELAKRVLRRVNELRSDARQASTETDTPQNVQDAARPTFTPLDYLRTRLDHYALIAVEQLDRLLHADVNAWMDRFSLLERELKQIHSRVCGEAEKGKPGPACQDGSEELAERVRAELKTLALTVDQRLQKDYLDGHGGLMATVMEGGRPRAQLISTLREKAERVIQEFLGEVSALDTMLADSNGSALRMQAQSATPRLLENGGSHRIVVVLPKSARKGAEADKVKELLGSSVSIVTGRDTNVTLCVEAENVPLTEVAINLVQRRRDHIEFAERVHCRNDIRWTKLTDHSIAHQSTCDERPAITMAIGDEAMTDRGPSLLVP